jgi:hypothetical protein
MRIRQFTDDDWPKFEAFSIKHFGQSHTANRQFNEHWFKTPWNQGWAAQILEGADKQILGLMMLIVIPAKFGDREVLLAWISSAATEDVAQKRGGGAQFFLWAYKAYSLVGGMSGNDLSTPINDVLSMSVPDLKMRRFIFIHDKRTADLCLPSGRTIVLNTQFNSSLAPVKNLTVEWVDEIPSDYASLWSRFRRKFVCTTERNREYMEWRYLKAPYVNYRFLIMRFDGKLCSFVAMRFQPTSEGVVCRVLDFIADDEWASQAWCSVINVAEGEGALFTDFMVIGTCQDEFLERAGFMPTDSETGLDVVPHLLSPVEHRPWSNTFHLGGSLAKADQSWRGHDAIYFTKGDGDRDWPTTYDLEPQSS